MIDSLEINSKIAKIVFLEMYGTGENPKQIILKKGLNQINDTGELESIISEVILKNPDAITQYKEGKVKAIGFLVGQVMARTQGKANPQAVNEIIIKKIT
jgi:aspartyl-tRNA(Asn)/glutamyl-tRNA(Gln) amidotransferase subunit B